MRRLILASTSAYRRQLLERFGVPFETRAPDVDESERPGETPLALAQRLAASKAASVGDADALVVGSDQVAARAGRILRKPGSHDRALRQLAACRGRSVDFFTAVTVVDGATGRRWEHIDHTEVAFAALDEALLDAYLHREQPYDCAGGFKAEGLGIALFTRVRSEDPTALIGLPLIWLAQTLRKAGLDPLEAP